MGPGERRDYVCRERLIGAQAFMDEEWQEPDQWGSPVTAIRAERA
jgi:hypothetical protein